MHEIRLGGEMQFSDVIIKLHEIDTGKKSHIVSFATFRHAENEAAIQLIPEKLIPDN